MLNKINMIKIAKPDNPSHQKEFTYDGVFGEDSTQQQVYDDAAFSLIESVLEGYNGKQALSFLSSCELIGRAGDLVKLTGIKNQRDFKSKPKIQD